MAAYATITQAQTFFDTQLDTADWDTASTAQRTAALAMATVSIDRLNFVGTLYDEDQVNQFPRDDDSTVPQLIIDATCLEALELLKGRDLEQERLNLQTSQEQMGPIKTNTDTSMPRINIVNGILSYTAWLTLQPFFRDGNSFDIARVS